MIARVVRDTSNMYWFILSSEGESHIIRAGYTDADAYYTVLRHLTGYRGELDTIYTGIGYDFTIISKNNVMGNTRKSYSSRTVLYGYVEPIPTTEKDVA